MRYLNWPENDIHVTVDTLWRVHGATAASGDGKHCLLILQKISHHFAHLLGGRKLMKQPQGREHTSPPISYWHYFPHWLFRATQCDTAQVPAWKMEPDRWWAQASSPSVLPSFTTLWSKGSIFLGVANPGMVGIEMQNQCWLLMPSGGYLLIVLFCLPKVLGMYLGM